MRIIFIGLLHGLCFLQIVCLPSFGQSAKMDSLQRLLSTAQADTSKVKLLNDIAYEYWSTDPQQVRHYAEQALTLAKKINFPAGIAKGYQGMGIYYWKTDQHAEAIAQYEQSKKVYEQIGDAAGMAKTLTNIGMVYKDQGNYVLALDHYLEALALVQKAGDTRTEANILNSIGVLYKNRQDYQQAVTYLNEALAKWQQLGMQPNVAGGLNNLAGILAEQKQYEKAIQYNERALRIFESLKDLNGQIICQNNMGDFYVKQGNSSAAKTYFKAAMHLNRAYGNKKALVSSHNGLGAVFAKLQQYPTSVAHYDSAYSLAQSTKLMPALQTAAAGLAEVYAAQRNYQKAYQYQHEYSSLKDSLYSEASTKQLANLQASFENEKKQAQIELLEKEKSVAKATRNGLAVGLASLLIIATLLLQGQRLKMRKNKELLEKNKLLYETQQALAEAQLRNHELQTRQLQEELEFRNKSLTTHTLNLIQKNGIMEEIRETISDVLKSPRKDEHAPVYGRLIKLIDYSFSLDKDWDDFKVYFEQVHKGFFVKLKEKHPDLSGGDLKMAALVRLNMNLKETATVMGISPDSVKTSRYRLRKKLQLEEEQSMTDYLMTIS